ncbi:MAG: (2Fe-2S)-binding protein [Deltaproteobacteria bacterium]|nr:(2Fe-2S)-binding protein [Deltaproteobacteria bacterium]
MLVCLCQGVSDKEVRQAIARGATTRKQVTRACGAGAGCGGCHESIQDLIQKHAACERGGEAPPSGPVKSSAYGAAVSA